MHFRRMNGTENVAWQSGGIVIRDLDEYRESLGSLWDLEVSQLEAARAVIRCRFVTDGEAILYEEHFGVGNLQRGCLEGDKIVVALPDPVARTGRWQGEVRSGPSLACAWSGEALNLMIPAGSAIRVAIFPAQRFERDFGALAGRDARMVFRRGRIFVGTPMRDWDRLWRSWGRIIDAGPGSEDLGTRLTSELVAALDFQVGRPVPERGARWSNYRRMIERLNHADIPVSAGALALELGISLRSLNEACARSVGLPPGRFLKLQRLNRVRRELLRHRSGTRTVTSLAIDQGFTELGRFAGEYRRLFGELPSETLARRPAPAVPFG